MSSQPTIYHNPRCSKSRATLAILEQHETNPIIKEYLKTPPSEQELIEVLSMLELEPRQLMRTGQSEYSDLNLVDDTLSDQDLIKAMIANPILIERPIVIHKGKAVIGRPPENVQALL